MRIAGRRGLRNVGPDPRTPRFGAIFNLAKLPPHPATFGWWYDIPEASWGMLGNDVHSDCVPAGYAHHLRYWSALGGRPIDFSLDSVLAAYTGIAGFNKWNPLSDQGCDMDAGAAYLQSTGLVDTAGRAHRVQARVKLEPGNWEQLCQAAWLFDGAGVGIYLPSDAEDCFSRGVPWTSTAQAPGDGHYVMAMGLNSRGMIVLVTWGGLQAMGRPWYEKYGAAAYCYFSPDAISSKGISRESFDTATLAQYMGSMG